jgi:hypothetical protein
MFVKKLQRFIRSYMLHNSHQAFKGNNATLVTSVPLLTVFIIKDNGAYMAKSVSEKVAETEITV